MIATGGSRAGGASGRAAAGGLDGLGATLAMSGVMYGARRAGWLGTPPPAAITERALHAIGAHGAARRGTPALAWGAHLAFGAACGALYGAAARAPRSWARAAVEGAAYGAAIWLVSYAGWVPALSILPPPHRDRPGRPPAMVAAHLVFGAVLGALGERRRRRRVGGIRAAG
jgi:hypothetical protein